MAKPRGFKSEGTGFLSCSLAEPKWLVSHLKGVTSDKVSLKLWTVTFAKGPVRKRALRRDVNSVDSCLRLGSLNHA